MSLFDLKKNESLRLQSIPNPNIQSIRSILTLRDYAFFRIKVRVILKSKR